MSQCADETYDVYDERWVTCRKPKPCHACKETIPAGVKYSRVGVVWDGSAESVVRCARCQTIHEYLRGVMDYDEWPAERLDCGHEYEELHGEAPPDAIASLAFWLPGDPLPVKP